jgi:NAD(P)-dependent dehydrogenase (short-subunit alcohol dehydrogenase family)
MGALTNKVAVVTGVSKGIGAGIAVAFGAVSDRRGLHGDRGSQPHAL